ncbi:MAG: four helix bundle protein [Caulobacter sp.]|nr:four helix bundle protein [Caulobacter sp.]
MASYRDLLVWQKAMDLAQGAYSLARLMPRVEQFRLTAQLLRAAVSVPANIAEGRARTGKREFLNFLSIASGSLAETETLLMLAVRTGLLPKADVVPVFRTAEEVGRMLTALKQSLRQRSAAQP